MPGGTDLRVLWFTHSLAYNEKDSGPIVMLPPWVEAAAKQADLKSKIQLGIAFLCDNASLTQFTSEGIIYYPISNGLATPLHKWAHKISHSVSIWNGKKRVNQIVAEYDPVLIQVFGTEFEFAELLCGVRQPVLVHLLSVSTAYLEKWFAGVRNPFQVLLNSSLFNIAKGAGPFHAFFRFKKQAQRELRIFACQNFFLGRTAWDKSWTKRITNSARYFHCDEMMRPAFYRRSWVHPHEWELSVVSVINPNIYKGLELIYRVSARLRREGFNCRWHVAGFSENTDVNRIALAQLDAADKRDANVHFCGSMSEEALIELLLGSRMLVHPSHIENSSNAVCEAMLLGMPVICTDAGGSSSIITDKMNGILVPPGNAQWMTQAVIDLLLRPGEASKIGAAARATAIERHDPAKISAQLLQIYDEVLLNGKQK